MSILISHFLLNIRDVAYGTQGHGSETEQILTDLVFNHASHHTNESRLASFVEPMDASLRYGEDDDDEEGGWEDERPPNTGAEERDA